MYYNYRHTFVPHKHRISMHYVAKLPCNLSLIVCFFDIKVSQGSVIAYPVYASLQGVVGSTLPVSALLQVY